MSQNPFTSGFARTVEREYPTVGQSVLIAQQRLEKERAQKADQAFKTQKANLESRDEAWEQISSRTSELLPQHTEILKPLIEKWQSESTAQVRNASGLEGVVGFLDTETGREIQRLQTTMQGMATSMDELSSLRKVDVNRNGQNTSYDWDAMLNDAEKKVNALEPFSSSEFSGNYKYRKSSAIAKNLYDQVGTDSIETQVINPNGTTTKTTVDANALYERDPLTGRIARNEKDQRIIKKDIETIELLMQNNPDFKNKIDYLVESGEAGSISEAGAMILNSFAPPTEESVLTTPAKKSASTTINIDTKAKDAGDFLSENSRRLIDNDLVESTFNSITRSDGTNMFEARKSEDGTKYIITPLGVGDFDLDGIATQKGGVIEISVNPTAKDIAKLNLLQQRLSKEFGASNALRVGATTPTEDGGAKKSIGGGYTPPE